MTTDIQVLQATIEVLTEDRDQARRDADELLRRYDAAEQRERTAQETIARMREEQRTRTLEWTQLGQTLLDAARALGSSDPALCAALDAIAAEERRAQPSIRTR